MADETKLNPREARQGRMAPMVRRILVISLVTAVVALAAAWALRGFWPLN